MVTAVIGQPDVAPPAATTARESMRARFPARPVPASWPATLQPRDTAWERLNRPPFVLDDAKGQQRRVRGLAPLLDWLAAQPGQTWQERWLASGADHAGAGWRQLPAAWLHHHGLHSERRQAELCAALTVAICADLVRPSLGWLVSADARGNGALVRLCRNCVATARAETCSRCGVRREAATRDEQGRALCPGCLITDPANQEICLTCRRRRPVSVRTPAGPLCPSCRPIATVTCSICGRAAPGSISRLTGQACCHACLQRLRHRQAGSQRNPHSATLRFLHWP
ncbi:MAG: hypothetical protein ACRDOK_29245 [Streptosporangiaceae bacterium]